MWLKRQMWRGFGLLCVVLAIVGVALPLVPTTPFLLLAAFAFARSSPRLHAWLMSHRQFGPLIRNWREHGRIDRRSKLLAVFAMLVAVALSLWLQVRVELILVQLLVLSVVAVFILSRPDGSEGDS
ncbi:YbaN family protein [Maricaulis sp.]|uniref:YbaN family protein n=1 Tax=Maricaulis sp. TaxID=1486257 RepID=UPI002B269592|nr:YbaN family protein [Maricaulis sp.]